MQGTWLSIETGSAAVIDPPGDVRGLLDLSQQDSTSDRMNRPCWKVEDIPRLHLDLVQCHRTVTTGADPFDQAADIPSISQTDL